MNSSDRILSLSAMLVGISSLVVVVYQTSLERQTQRATVLPYLYIALIANPKDGVGINVVNSGLGPALIDDVRIRHRGREIAADPFDFFVEQRPEVAKLGLGVDKVQPGRLIPAGVWVRMLSNERGLEMLPEFLRLFEIAEAPRKWYVDFDAVGGDKAVIEITYSSVYGERWRVRSDKIVPQKQ